MYFFNSLGCFTMTSDKVTDCDSNDGGNNCCSTTDHVMSTNRNDNSSSSICVKKITWEDIKKRSSWKVIGSGGFSTVYLARLPDFGLTAVKIQSACTERLARVHEQELQILMRVKHPNIVKFVGHCDDSREEERVLLFEYVSNGTLHDKLLLGALTWKARTLIAFQLAQALDYLHGIQVIHGDIKASNILLDQQQNCKVCDFGSAKFGFTSMVLPPSSSSSKMIIGSQGYLDPHYLKTGSVSKKNDIYSFGVVLLQLITGKQAFSMETGENLTYIINISSPVMINEEVVDPQLRNDINLEEVMAMVSLAGMCINSSPMARPSANEIVATMRRQLFQSIGTCD